MQQKSECGSRVQGSLWFWDQGLHARTRKRALGAEGSPPADGHQRNRPQSYNCQELYSAGNVNELASNSPPDSPVRNVAVWYLLFARWDPSQTSNLQNCDITDLCCFKPLSLWQFVTAAIGNSYSDIIYVKTPSGASGRLWRSTKVHWLP